MKPIITRRKTCRLCNGNEHSLILKLAPSPIADAYIPMTDTPPTQESFPMDLFLCTTCGQAQILDVIDASVLYRDYIYVTTSSMGLSEHFNRYAEHVTKVLSPQPNSLVIDIGSNDGTLLSHFKKRNLNVLGVEPASEIAHDATSRGIKTLPEFFSSSLSKNIVSEFGKAQIITMNNLFANIDELQDVVLGIKNLLASDGVFVFETFYFLDYINNMVFDFMYHEHLSYNTVKPLSKFFASLGLDLFEVESIPTKGGSIRCYVQLAGAKRARSKRVEEFQTKEEKAQIHQADSALFTSFRNRIDQLKNKTKTELQRLKKEGKTIACYGASATTTTLIYHFDILKEIDFMIDENPAKQNTLSPGCHLPVYSDQAMKEKKPDVVFIAAWRYAEPIMKKNAEYKKTGGTFIIPLPEFKTL